MTVANPVNEWYSTHQQSPVTATPRRGAVLHHGATTSMDAILQMEISGSRQVSSNRVAKDTRLARVVADGMRAWSLSDSYWDSVLSSVECANESTAGWTISAASHETLAQQVAFWSQEEGWWPHRTGDPTTWTVYGHREIYTIFGGSYATACPGGMDLDWIAARAAALRGTPITRKKENMTTVYADDSTMVNRTPNPKTVFALGGDSPGTPANWFVMTEATLPGVRGQMERYYGAAVILDHTTFLAMEKAYLAPLKTTGGSSGGGTLPDSIELGPTSLAALASLGVKIDALPAQIDQYADGKKQS